MIRLHLLIGLPTEREEGKRNALFPLPFRLAYPLHPQSVAGQPQFLLATSVTSCGQRAY